MTPDTTLPVAATGCWREVTLPRHLIFCTAFVVSLNEIFVSASVAIELRVKLLYHLVVPPPVLDQVPAVQPVLLIGVGALNET